MDQRVKDQLGSAIQGFKLPRYHEIPDVGLYLEQTTKYVSDCLRPFSDLAITGSMISNYVKKGLISNPVKKQYSRDQIAQLIYIAVVKTVVSMDDLRLMFGIQMSTYPIQVAYDYFCSELETALECIFGRKDEMERISAASSDEKVMLRNVITTVAHKVYLGRLFATLREDEARSADRTGSGKEI